MKKLFTGLFITLFIGILAACSLDTKDVQASESYLLVEINPKIEFTLNEDEEVVSVDFLNEDAEALALELELVGLHYEVALDLFLEAALEAGYLDVSADDNAIFVTLYSDNEEYEEDIAERVRGRAEEFMVRERLKGGVFAGEFLHEDIQAIADEYEVRFNHARAAYAVSELYEDISLEEAIDMEFPELMGLLITRHQERMQQHGEEARARAREMREALMEENRERLEAHRANLDNIPESEIRERMQEMRQDIMSRINAMRESHEARRQERRDQFTPNTENDEDDE